MTSLNQRSGLLGHANSAHLLRRATFGATQDKINFFATKTAEEALGSLFQFDASLFPAPSYHGVPFMPTVSNPSIVNNSSVHNKIEFIECWWLNCAMADSGLQHKLSFFLHSIFIIKNRPGPNPHMFYDYLELLKWHANGSLKELAVRITRNLSMLFFLDNRANTVAWPNANYGREFLELFTIQKGTQIGPGDYTNYTEEDVTQASRVFTGFGGDKGTAYSRLNNFDSVTGIPHGTVTLSNHDIGNKTFSYAFGNRIITGRNTTDGMLEELQEFVDMVFSQVATARSYARRLYIFFVNRIITPEIENGIIVPLADTLMQNNYNLQIAVTRLLTSEHFFDENDSEKGNTIWGAKIKHPLDFYLGLYRQLEIVIPDYVTQYLSNFSFYNSHFIPRLHRLNLPFFQPFDVSGYPPDNKSPQYDRLWVTPLSLLVRYNEFIDPLISGFKYYTILFQFDSVLFVRNSGVFTDPADSATLLNECYDLMFVSRPQGGRHSYFLDSLLGGLSSINWRNDWNNYLSTNNKTSVKVSLDRLFKNLIKCPEYQVY